jgi:hypothetical protein
MLTSHIKCRLAIPDEPNDWMELRALGGNAKQEAEEVQQRKALEMAKLAGQELLEQMDTFDAAKARAALEADPLQKYDAETVVRKGIVSWSYPERVTPLNIADLDALTRDWAAREILKLTEEAETERKSKA